MGSPLLDRALAAVLLGALLSIANAARAQGPLRYLPAPATAGSSSIDATADVDGDGVGDALVASKESGGRLRVFDGSTLVRSYESGSPDPKPGEIFAASLSGVADFNLDGRPDWAVGAPSQAGGVWAFSSACGSATPWGVGCSGSGGFVPVLHVETEGCVAAGAHMRIDISQALGGASALLFVAGTPGSVPWLGYNLYAFPPLSVVPLVLSGSGPGAGSSSFSIDAAPAVPSGTVATLQALVADPGAANGLAAASNGFVLSFP